MRIVNKKNGNKRELPVGHDFVDGADEHVIVERLDHVVFRAAGIAAFLVALGANVDEMEVARHDLVLAVVSHTPHLIAYTIVGTADDLEEVTQSEVIKYSAGGFRDFTRIAETMRDAG